MSEQPKDRPGDADPSDASDPALDETIAIGGDEDTVRPGSGAEATGSRGGGTHHAEREPAQGHPPPGDAEQRAIGHFKIRAKLGEGGMGVVYKATDEQLGRTVALKLLRSSTSRGAERLLREARALARLAHPNVVAVHEVGAASGGVYIAMEFVRGKTLREWLEGERTWNEKVAVLRQAGEGLAAAHAKTLVHRDFKPDNVIVGDDGRVRVLDFGLAKGGPEHEEEASGANEEETLAALVDLTRDGAHAGTPAYMAPEQFRLEVAGPAADQFSFCAVLYQALYGQRAFVGKNFQTLGLQVLQGRVREPPEDVEVPDELWGLVRKGLSVDTKARHADMRTLLEALDACTASAPATKSAASRTSRLLIAAAGISFVLAAALGLRAAGVWGGLGDRAEDTASEPDEVARILAASNLPEVLSEPLADDATHTTIHRLENGLTVYVSPDDVDDEVGVHVVVDAGAPEVPGPTKAGLDEVLRRSLRLSSKRLGIREPRAFEEFRSKLGPLHVELEGTADLEERKAIAKRIDALEVEYQGAFVPDEASRVAKELNAGWFLSSPDPGVGVYGGVTRRPEALVALLAQIVREPDHRHFTRAVAGAVADSQSNRRQDWIGFSEQLLERLYGDEAWRSRVTPRAEDFLALNPSDLEAFHRDWYAPNNAALVFTGHVDREVAVGLAETYFGDWVPREIPARLPKAASATLPPRFELLHPRLEFVQLMWPMPELAPNEVDSARAALLAIGKDLASAERGVSLSVRNDAPSQALLVVRADRLDQESLAETELRAKAFVVRLREGEYDERALRESQAAADVRDRRWREDRSAVARSIAGVFGARVGWMEWVERTQHLESGSAGQARDLVQSLTEAEPSVLIVLKGDLPTVADPVAFQSTPLPDEGLKLSPAAQAILDIPAPDDEPQFVMNGVNVRRLEANAGELLATRHEGAGLFSFEVLTPWGVRIDPLLCASLEVEAKPEPNTVNDHFFKDPIDGPWKLDGTGVHVSCEVDRVRLVMAGSAEHFEDSLKALDLWMRTHVAAPDEFERKIKQQIDVRERPWTHRTAFNALVVNLRDGDASGWQALPATRLLRRADAHALLANRNAMWRSPHKFLYYGPEEATRVRSVLDQVWGERLSAREIEPPPQRTPIPGVTVVDMPDSPAAYAVLSHVGPQEHGPREWARTVLALAYQREKHETLEAAIPGVETARLRCRLTDPTLDRSVLDWNCLVREIPAKDVVVALTHLRERMKIPASDGLAFARALEVATKASRSSRTSKRKIPRKVVHWPAGVKTDPKQAWLPLLIDIKLDEIDTLMRTLREQEYSIGIVGDASQIDMKALRRLGTVRVIKPEELASY